MTNNPNFQTQPAQKKSPVVLILVLVIILVALIIAGVLGYLYLSDSPEPITTQFTASTPDPQPQAERSEPVTV